MEDLQSYQLGLLSGFLAMLPCSPAFLLGLPMGIWTLLVLQNWEVRAAFGGSQIPVAPVPTPALTPVPPPRRKGLIRRTFGTSTGWAMIFCVLGCLCSAFLPWVVETTWQVPGVLAFSTHIVLGFESRCGVLTAMTFFVLSLILVATGFLEPIPAWRPACLFVAGVAVIFFVSLAHDNSHSLRAGAYFAIVLAVGLLFMGALQVRRILINRGQTA
jgi:hypothetical protein